MKKIIFILIFLCLYKTAVAQTSYWVFYDEITCFVPLPPSVQTSWGGDGSEPVNFIVLEGATMLLTNCLDSCKLYASKVYDRVYTPQILGDTLLELHAKNMNGGIAKVLYYRRIEKSLELSFKNNENVFTNGNNFLFKNINVFARKRFDYNKEEYGYDTFYRISKNRGNLYDVRDKSGIFSSIERIDNVMFFVVDGKVYCEGFDRLDLYNYTYNPYYSDFEVCTLEDTRAEIQRIIKERRVLIED